VKNGFLQLLVRLEGGAFDEGFAELLAVPQHTSERVARTNAAAD
jgi:hypothetical protein